MEVIIQTSNQPDKRLTAKFPNKTIHFGSKAGQTFVDHKESSTKTAWKKRHQVRGTLNNLESASGLANNVLWNKPSIAESVRNMNAKQKKYKFVVKRNRANSK